ncbi:vWA domain-containing protein [Peribacillus sp. FSL H8-0477]|uniref:vWA domain-containing protein n=2 Tax=Peribacillus sp. FSL H8-0477 TaxID=2921388 RepID=UPI0030FC546B
MKLSRYISFVMISLLLTAGLLPIKGYAVDTGEKMDAVLVVDVSNSMNKSDKKKVSNEAMKMFVDMLSVSGDKVGLVAYTDQINREKALLEIHSEEDKTDFKEYIDSLTRGSYTDIAIGVNEAVKILDAGKDKGHSPLIILLADGINELNPDSGRTQKQSDKDMQTAINKAKAEGYPIYTIGLNADGKTNQSVLKNLSKETNGIYFTTNSADDLPSILSEIFAKHLKLKVVPVKNLTANGNYQDVVIDIPNENVMEANISITTNRPITAKLFDPDGKEVNIPSPNIIYSKSNAYSLIKLIKPAIGKWKIQVKGTNKDKIDVNMIYNYDLGLHLEEPANKNYGKNDTVAIKAFLETGGKKLQSPVMYEEMKAKLLVTDLTLKKVVEYPLDTDGKNFFSNWKIPDQHKYELKVLAEDNSFSRETNSIVIDASRKTSPVLAEETKESGVVKRLGIGIGLLAAMCFVLYLLSLVKKANRGFIGQMIIEVRDENTGEKTSPQYRKLNAFKGKVKLHQLLQLAPEFIETESIILVPGKNDTLMLYNKGEAVIERSGRAVDASEGLVLKKNDRLKIMLHKVNKSISLDYII